MWQRRGLVLLLYVFGLTVAVLVGSGLFRLLSYEIGSTGFSTHLVERFDIVLWADFLKGIGSGIAALARQAVLAGVIMMFWKVASGVGLIHALHGDGESSFWEGLGRFTLRGMVLGLLFFIPTVIILAVIIGVVVSTTPSMGQVEAFWTRLVVLPVVAIGLVATFDLFHDYARMHLVLRGATIPRAWLEGIMWPLRHLNAVLLYSIWFLLSAALWIGVAAVGYYLPDQTVGAVFVAFALQQVLIFGRMATHVSWIGAEVVYFEHFAPELVEPLIADEDAAEADAATTTRLRPETDDAKQLAQGA